mgnify:FL=1
MVWHISQLLKQPNIDRTRILSACALVQRKSRNCWTILQWIIQPFLTQYCWAMADATRKKFRPLDQGKIGMQDFGNKIYLVLVAS